MNHIQRTLRVMRFQLRRELLEKRTIILFVIIGIFVYSNMEPVANFCAVVGINATPVGFIHMMNDFIFQTTFMIGIVLLLSNAPFRGNIYPYIVYRSGDITWEIGNILYIIVMTFIYTVFIVLMSIVGLKGRVDFVCEWGKIWGTLARTTAANQFAVQFSVNDYIIGKFEPLYAIIVSFLLEWFCFIWLGMCIYFINSLSKKDIGIFVAGIFIFLDAMIYNSWTPWAYRFSPVTLCKLSTFTKSNIYYGLTLKYACIFYGVTIIFFVICSVLLKKKVGDYE